VEFKIIFVFRSWGRGSHEHGESNKIGVLTSATSCIVSVIKAEDKLVGICGKN